MASFAQLFNFFRLGKHRPKKPLTEDEKELLKNHAAQKSLRKFNKEMDKLKSDLIKIGSKNRGHYKDTLKKLGKM